MANKDPVTDPERLAQLLGRLREVCETATELAKEVKGQLREVERRRAQEYRAAQKRRKKEPKRVRVPRKRR